MERKGRRIHGIFRLNNWAENDFARFRRTSVHIYFSAHIFRNKNGGIGFFGITFPKLTQILLLLAVALLTFLFSFKQDLTETGVFAYSFGMMLVYLLFEFTAQTVKLSKELRKIFEKDL